MEAHILKHLHSTANGQRDLASATAALKLWHCLLSPAYRFLPYASGPQKDVDQKHNLLQIHGGEAVISVESLGGSSPYGLCPAGCCWWFEWSVGLPGLS